MLERSRPLRWILVLLVFGVDLLVWGGDTRTFAGHGLSPALVIGIGVIGYGFLAIPRSPLPGYVAMLVLGCGGFIIPTVESLAGFLLALFLMARHCTARAARWALAWAALPIAANTFTNIGFHQPADPLFVALNVSLWTVLVLTVWIAGRTLARSSHKLATERRWAADAREEATAMERLRISRDLHDSLAHSLTAILLQVAGVRAAMKAGKSEVDVDGVLGAVQETAEQSMRELHRMLGLLRNVTDQDDLLRPHGLEDAGELFHSARASGLEITSSTQGTALPLDPSIGHTAFRVIQEGLSNTMKHAGEGAKADIGYLWHAETLVLSIRSTSGVLGRQLAASGGYGLEGLRERVVVSGGTLHSGPTPEGFLLQATLPAIALPAAGSTKVHNSRYMEEE
ncbi:sensor histidine kinase [Arthrobacter sp.]|uniref:sensor histidine kinase n=1 Tax=Arthrobacter sp. TaxID=1667 RepID=UPI0026DFA74D|nr:histidine kinase [Arthrobacter sp.]MDO5753320.1 histidine kinase [Arthrobacter sp.]